MKRLALCFAFAFFGCQNPGGTGGTGGGSGGGDPLSTDPAVLSVEAALSSAHVTLGQQVSLTLTVKNTGKSPALGVSTAPLAQAGAGRVRLAATAAEGTVDLQPGDAHAFVLTLEAADPGEVTLSGTVEAMDGPTSSAISADFGPLVMMMESPSYLTVSETHAPLATNVNQDTAVTVTVSNDGEAEARMVAVQLDGAAGSVAFERRNGPTPVVANLKAGESQTFTFTVKPTAAGNLALKAHAFGLDANDMTALESDEVAFGSIGVERPAHLVAELELADSTTTGQLTTATLVVRNDGDALARGVLPTPAIPLAITVSGNASATASAAPTAVDVPGGSTATFTWAYVASGTGSFSLSARVRGVDQNSGETVEALAAAQTAAVIAPSALQIVELSAPTVVNPAQGFDLTLKVKNGGGTAANGVLPDPMPPALVASAAALARLNGAAPAAQNIAPGATATFVFHYLENGTGVGTLKFSAGARGVDAVSGAPLVGITTQSNTVSVLGPPVLAIEAVTPPLKLSRNQTFNVEVRVKNTGGTAATNVLPALSFAATGEALATVTPVAAQTIAAGGRGIFTIVCRETGTGLGTLRARASATGLNPNFGTALTAAAMTAPAVSTVQEPAALSVVTFMLPASLSRGATFSLGMVVANTGQADAKSVVPTSATATVSGGTTATLVTGPTALTIPGGKTRTFTWQYRESGTAAGTLGFRAGATGADLNSNAALSAVAVSSNVTPVDVYLGCNGSALYPSLDGHLLDRDRSDLVPGSDRLRVKPYSALLNDFTRALGSQPASIRGQVATFDAYNPAAYGAMPPLAQPRWLEEQELAAISLYRVFIAAYQACVTLTASGTQYAAAPTAATATTECRSWQRRFWSATPGAAETTACASFAVSAENDGATPQLKWAATCATAATSMGFLAE